MKKFFKRILTNGKNAKEHKRTLLEATGHPKY